MALFESFGSRVSRGTSSGVSDGGGVLNSCQAMMPVIPKNAKGTVV